MRWFKNKNGTEFLPDRPFTTKVITWISYRLNKRVLLTDVMTPIILVKDNDFTLPLKVSIDWRRQIRFFIGGLGELRKSIWST